MSGIHPQQLLARVQLPWGWDVGAAALSWVHAFAACLLHACEAPGGAGDTHCWLVCWLALLS